MKLFILVTFLTLAACSAVPGSKIVADAAKVEGARAADEALENAHWFTCYAATIGSIRRKYGNNRDTYNAFCDEGNAP